MKKQREDSADLYSVKIPVVEESLPFASMTLLSSPQPYNINVLIASNLTHTRVDFVIFKSAG